MNDQPVRILYPQTQKEPMNTPNKNNPISQTPDRPKPIQVATEHITNATEHLDKQLHQLQQELDPLLTPEHPDPSCTTDAKEPTTSPHTIALTAILTHLNNLTARIDNILARLEI